MIFAKVPIEALFLIGGLLVFALVVIVASVKRDKARSAAVAGLLTSHGFAVVVRPSRVAQTDLFAPFSAAPPLKHGAKGIRWGATGTLGGRPVRIIEHLYMVHTGKSSHAVVNTCIAITGGGSWPFLTLATENFLHRLGEKLGVRPDIDLDSEEFNRRWRVRCEDEGFAIAILDPAVQAALAGSNAADWWCFGGPGGLVCLGRTAAADAAVITEMLSRFEAVVGAMPAEARAGLGI